MRLVFTLLTGLLLLSPLAVSAQPPDTIVQPVPDTIITSGVDLRLPAGAVSREYDPRQALLWSLVPGGGQVYNRRWWKVPLVYSAMSSMIAIFDYNQSNYNRLQRAYELELAGEEHEFTGTRLESAESLRSLRDGFDRNRQLSIFGLFAIYALQGVEAFVDTHLRNFDIDEDLSRWEVRPRLIVPYPGAAPRPVVVATYSF